MQFAVLPARTQMPSTSNKTSYNLLQSPLLSKVGVKEGVAKHNPNDLHWFPSPFKCCKKDSTHLTYPPLKKNTNVPNSGLTKPSTCTDLVIVVKTESMKSLAPGKRKKKSLELGFSVTNVCTFFLILPFCKVYGLAGDVVQSMCVCMNVVSEEALQ